MSFAGKMWRFLVGVKDALALLLMLIFFGIIYAILSTSPYRDSAHSGALRIDLKGALVEQPAQRGAFDALGGTPLTREYRVAQLIHSIDAAATSDRIHAIALDLDSFTGGGLTAITDVGAALDRARRAGKRVVAFATGYDDDSYQLAAHADEIWLDPLGAVLVTGPGGSNLYYARLMERLGVTANVYRVGAYKSAVEPYTRSDMSPESRQQSEALAAALWQGWQQDVAHARPRAQLAPWLADPNRFIQGAGGNMARAALAAGLVDHIGDRITFGRRMAELAGGAQENVPGTYAAVHLDAWAEDNPVSDHGGQIGVLTVAGNIVDGRAGPGTAGAETIVANLERGLRERTLRALVVRIDSPGGSTFASERIRRAIEAVRARGIPVVISMGNVAASGGYWVATTGDVVFAEPTTITGSIGVFGILPSFEGALQRLGVGVDGVRTTPLSGEPDILRGPSPQADQLLQTGVESTYRRFVALVSRARNLTPRRVHEIAQGRVWDGGSAHQLGLVDRFGTLDDAIAEAARRANLEGSAARPVWLEPEPGFWAEILRGVAEGEEQSDQAQGGYARLAERPEALVARAISDAQSLMSGPAIQARCLECPAVAPPRLPAPAVQVSWLSRLIAAVWR